jgi:uridine kinase
MDPARARAVARIAEIVSEQVLTHPTRVAVDGVSAAGKSTLAAELVVAVAAGGRPAVHLSMDGYHHPRERRYRQGRRSATGYYDDAFDFSAFAEQVLIPLGPSGDRRYRERIRDLATDEPIEEPPREVAADGLVIVDGSFLQRPELFEHWDQRIFVDTSLAVARARGVARDAGQLGGRAEAESLYDERYHAAARIYLGAVRPHERATLVVQNDDPANPQLHFPGDR